MYDCNLELLAKTVKQRNLSSSVPPKDTRTWLWLDFNPDSVNQKLHMLLLGYVALEVVNCMCKDDVVNTISVHTSVGNIEDFSTYQGGKKFQRWLIVKTKK